MQIHVVDNFLTNNKDEETKKIIELIEKNFLVQFFNKNTKIVYNESFTKNTLKNLFYSSNLKILNSIHYEGIKTAVIVGAGPSLNKNINILKKNKDKVLVISCLHALPALIRNKIDPDIVLHIHGKDAEGFLTILKLDKSFWFSCICSTSRPIFVSLSTILANIFSNFFSKNEDLTRISAS